MRKSGTVREETSPASSCKAKHKLRTPLRSQNFRISLHKGPHQLLPYFWSSKRLVSAIAQPYTSCQQRRTVTRMAGARRRWREAAGVPSFSDDVTRCPPPCEQYRPDVRTSPSVSVFVTPLEPAKAGVPNPEQKLVLRRTNGWERD